VKAGRDGVVRARLCIGTIEQNAPGYSVSHRRSPVVCDSPAPAEIEIRIWMRKGLYRGPGRYPEVDPVVERSKNVDDLHWVGHCVGQCDGPWRIAERLGADECAFLDRRTGPSRVRAVGEMGLGLVSAVSILRVRRRAGRQRILTLDTTAMFGPTSRTTHADCLVPTLVDRGELDAGSRDRVSTMS